MNLSDVTDRSVADSEDWPEWTIRFWCGHWGEGAAYPTKPAGQVFCPGCGVERTVLSAWRFR